MKRYAARSGLRVSRARKVIDPALARGLLMGVSIAMGSSLGSAAGVVYRRVLLPDSRPLRLPYREPRSRCQFCGERIALWLNVPVVAWLMLAGRTRCCHRPIGVAELLLELGGAVCGLVLGLLLFK